MIALWVELDAPGLSYDEVVRRAAVALAELGPGTVEVMDELIDIGDGDAWEFEELYGYPPPLTPSAEISPASRTAPRTAD